MSFVDLISDCSSVFSFFGSVISSLPSEILLLGGSVFAILLFVGIAKMIIVR